MGTERRPAPQVVLVEHSVANPVPGPAVEPQAGAPATATAEKKPFCRKRRKNVRKL